MTKFTTFFGAKFPIDFNFKFEVQLFPVVAQWV
jgi:hypothetical protein